MFTWPVISGLSAGWLAAGAAAAAIPFAIHLWAKRRACVVLFPAARFALQAATGAKSRRRLRDHALLSLRALALIVLASAFARPLLESAAFPSGTVGSGTSLVILLDASASMRRSESGVSLFDSARERALAMLRRLDPRRDRAAVVLIGADPRAILPQLSENSAFLASAVESATPTLEPGDAGRAMALAESILSNDRSAGRGVVVVLSDMQATQWRGVAAGSSHAERRIERIGPESSDGNLAITDLVASPAAPIIGRQATLNAVVRNHSDEARSILVRFASAGRAIGETVVHLPAWSERDATIAARFDDPGPAPIEAAVAPDGFAFDDSVRAEINVIDAPRYALVTIGTTEIDPKSSDWFIRAALGASGSNTPEILGPTELADQDLSRFDAVAVADSSPLAASHMSALRGFASRGGVVLLFVDPGGPRDALSPQPVEGSIWPMTLAPAPAMPGRVRCSLGSAAMESGTPLAEILRAWDGVETTASFRSALHPHASALLETDQGPVVACLRVDGGAVVMFNLDLYPARSPFVRAPIFPALIHAVLERERQESRGAAAAGTNIDPAESDCRALNEDEARALERVPPSEAGQAVDQPPRPLGGPPVETWPWLLAASLGLLIAEGWLRQRPAGTGGPR